MTTQRTGEQILEEGLLSTHGKLEPASAFFDPTTLARIITDILELFRGCSSPARARLQIQRGGAIAKTSIRNVLRKNGYRGRDLWQTASDLAEQGTKLSEADIDALLEDAADVPTPPPSNNWWAATSLALALVLLPNFASAADWWPSEPSVVHDVNFWPEFNPPAVVSPEPPKTTAKPDLPWVQPWVFYGDTGPASMRQHLMEPDHQRHAMAYLGISSLAEYQRELARLDHGELKQLHSIAHERQEGRRVPPLQRDRPGVRPTDRQPVIRQISYDPTQPQPTVNYQGNAPASGGVRQRAGLFGRRMLVGRSYCPAGGCP